MPRLPVKQRAAEQVSIQLSDGRYCARANDAPPSDSWESHVNFLLSNLPPDKAKRVKILEKSISSLKSKREEFRREKKTGASVATEALEFYSYVLEINQTWKVKNAIPTKVSPKKTEEVIIVHEAEDEPTTANEEDSERKGKRQRRQPLLFDPLTCSASAWVGEGGGGTHRGTTEKLTPVSAASSNPLTSWSDEKDPHIRKVLESLIEEKREQYSFSKTNECRFCRGDNNVHVCCFCACRICFVKCDKNQTVLCDICNADFHAYCLVPPLDPIPKGEWYCPACVSTIRYSLEHKMKAKSEKCHAAGPADSSTSSTTITGKRGPGRPRQQDNTLKDPSIDRNKRDARTTSMGRKNNNDATPRKSPRSKSLEQSSEEYEENVLATDSTHRSRSGRLLKRNNFYDQVEEKDQHLRSATRTSTVEADEENTYEDLSSATEFKRAKLEENQNVPELSLGSDAVKADPMLEGSQTFDNQILKRTLESNAHSAESYEPSSVVIKVPRRKPGARECMQLSRRFGVNVIPQKYIDILMDYCNRGKVEHLIRMRERLDEHSTFLELQLAGFEASVQDLNESNQGTSDVKPDNLVDESIETTNVA